jgi:hypothetical protein
MQHVLFFSHSICFLVIYSLQDLLDKAWLRQCSGKLDTIIDDGFWHAMNPVTLREIYELRGFYHIRGNMLVLNG